MTYLFFLLAGLGILWLGRKTTDDIPFIGTSVSGVILLIWGFAIAPLSFQLLIEILLVGLSFSLCVRGCNFSSKRSQ